MSDDLQSPIANLLREGIAAVKARDFEKARALLMQVVEQDERNEQAWLWLSGAVETDDDRRICLENVLAINSDNAAARAGLAKLGPAPDSNNRGPAATPDPEPVGDEHVVRREVAPVSLAAAILHPEAQIKEWRWHDPTPLQRASAVETQAMSAFDDVWNSAKDICGYCAQEVTEDDRQCPRCRRNLIGAQFYYPQPGTSLWYLVIMAQSLAAQFVVQVFFVDIGIEAQGLLIAVDAFALLLLVICTVGLYLRRRWAYLGVLPMFAVVVFGALFRLGSGITTKNQFVALVAAILPAAQIITSLLGLLIGIFRAGREFELSENRRVMRLGADLKLTDEMGDYYHVGKRYADQGLWAMAVPYWQRAAAADPTRSFYQRMLGEAYARLGFHARSLDALQSAGRATIDPKVKAEVEEMIVEVKQRMNNE